MTSVRNDGALCNDKATLCANPPLSIVLNHILLRVCVNSPAAGQRRINHAVWDLVGADFVRLKDD